MKAHRRARAGRRASGTPATGGPVTANYLYSLPNEEVDINVFATSEKGQLLQAFVSPTPFFSNLGATNLGGGLGPLLAAVQGGTEAWFFGVTEGGHLLSQYWQDTDWSGWQDLGMPDSSLGGLAWALGATNPTRTGALAFAVTESARLVLRDIASSEWQDLGTCEIGGGLGYSIAATCPQEGLIFVVGAAIDGDVVVLPYSGGQWGEWSILAHPPGLLIESVSAASGPNALDLVAVAEDGSVWYTYSADGRSFATWQQINSGKVVLPGLTAGSVSPYPASNQLYPGYDHQLDVFAISEDGDFLWCWWTAKQGWTSWSDYGVWPS
jgi:hypothetical protein